MDITNVIEVSTLNIDNLLIPKGRNNKFSKWVTHTPTPKMKIQPRNTKFWLRHTPKG